MYISVLATPWALLIIIIIIITSSDDIQPSTLNSDQSPSELLLDIKVTGI